MREVIPYIVYPWVAVSLFIYGRRLYRRVAGPSAGPDSTPPAGPPRVAPPTADQRASGGPAAASTPAVPHVSATPDLLPPPTQVTDAEGRPVVHATHYPLEPAVAAALEEERRSQAAPGGESSGDDVPGATRTGLFAKADPGPGAATLPVLIAGIELPCDLAPLVSADDLARAAEHAAFVTSDHDPATVAREVGDELERLGFRLQSLADDQVLASRGDGAVVVTVVPHPASVERESVRPFPTTRDGDVVIEFDLR